MPPSAPSCRRCGHDAASTRSPNAKAAWAPRYVLVMFAVLGIVAIGLGFYALHLSAGSRVTRRPLPSSN